VRTDAKGRHRLLDQVGEVEFDFFDLHASGFDLRQIEDAVDEFE
jgi:hypothetical protein